MTTTTDTTATRSLLHHMVDNVRRRKAEHLSMYVRLRRVHIITNTLINVLNTITVTSIIITFYGRYMVMVACAIANSLSTLMSVVVSTTHLRTKYQSHHKSYLRYKSLHDRFRLVMIEPTGSGTDMPRLIQELNDCIGLILDKSEPISLSSYRFVNIGAYDHQSSPSRVSCTPDLDKRTDDD